MIREAKPEDVYAIIKIEKDAFLKPLELSFIFQELTDNPFSKYFVYEMDRLIIAYIGYRVIDQDAEMMNFAVLKTYQGQGHGKKLLKDSLDQLIQMNVKSIVLEVRKSNHVAQNLYHQLGFIKSHLRKNYYENEDAIIYVKEVK